MKILHIVAGAPVGGAETFSRDLIGALAEKGVGQRVITRPHPLAMEKFARAGAETVPFDFTFLDRFFAGERLIRKQVADFKPDIVHAWMSRASSFLPSGLAPIAIGWLGGYYKIKNFKNCDYMIGVTPDIVRHLLKSGAPPHRVGVVNTFGTLEDSPALSRADLDTPEDAPVVLVLSRMHEKKGIDTILNALAHCPGLYLWLAGDGPERATYQRLCVSLNLSDRVRFLGWREDRKALLEACDICALPSRYEPFGTVIAEAWSMERPLVAAAAAGARQYVVDGVNGLLSPINDIDALAHNLRRVAADRDLRRALSAGGLASYRSTFTKDIVAGRMLDFYARTLVMGKRETDAFIPADGIDPGQASLLADLFRGSSPDFAVERLAPAARVALAYVKAGRPEPLAAAAAALELSGRASLVEGARILLVGEEDIARLSPILDAPLSVAAAGEALARLGAPV